MATNPTSRIPAILKERGEPLLKDWTQLQLVAPTFRADLITETELRQQSAEFLRRLQRAAEEGDLEDIEGPAWTDVRGMLSDLSRSRALKGFTPIEVATFVFSFKEPLFAEIRASVEGDADVHADELWQATRLLDRLGLYTMEVYQKSREEVIHRQQQELLELSTPVVNLWEEVVAVPLIGTLDSARTQVVTESLLEKIVDAGARIAIIDITGVPTVDTLVAQHLIKTVAAARLMGADCIISGIRPQIAQTIVHLGVDLGDVITKATLADAIAVALRQTGFQVTRTSPAGV
jgi:rsbT co-antagonist protein RsbR